jgi:hypothetical protein
VFATAAVLADARELLGDGTPVETAVGRAIDRGRATRTPIPGVELPDGALLVRPFDADWAAIVRRSQGRLVRRRSNCFEIVRVLLVIGSQTAVREDPR